MPDTTILLVAGMICVVISGYMVYKLPPREGKPPSAWTRTETRAMGSAMLVLILFFAGAIMVAKAIF
jgi:hypothetical protein